MKILLLEDNISLAEIIKDVFEDKGYMIDWFEDGENALESIVNGYDCFILDIHVPSFNGIELLKEIKQRYSNTPVIIISSDIELGTIQSAYLQGCSDFLKKPFYMQELEYKIDMLCKKDRIVKFSNEISFNIDTETLLNKQQEIKMTRREKRFLTLLCKTPNNFVLLDAISDYVYEGEVSTLDGLRSLVKRIRKKLPSNCIETQNYGYKLIVLN